ncbi:hypothetical protein ACIGGF_12250 [Rhodococcus sp. NPDC078407]|uniref:hypothetical protein n=1 Tax=Rhodococcus sp. NPDC078407 TaxID=3364509 RepID=UPI0037C74349
MNPPNVRRIFGSHNPDDRSYTGLGYVDKDGVYYFPNGSFLPASGGITSPDGTHQLGGMTLVVREDGSPSTIPTPDAADPVDSALQRLHCVDTKRQDAYDLAEFGVVGGPPVVEPVDFDPILPMSGGLGADPHSPEVRAYEVDSPARDAAVAESRRTHPERHQGTSPYTDPGSPYNPFTPIEYR